MVMNVDNCDFTIYTNPASLCCTPEANGTPAKRSRVTIYSQGPLGRQGELQQVKSPPGPGTRQARTAQLLTTSENLLKQLSTCSLLGSPVTRAQAVAGLQPQEAGPAEQPQTRPPLGKAWDDAATWWLLGCITTSKVPSLTASAPATSTLCWVLRPEHVHASKLGN